MSRWFLMAALGLMTAPAAQASQASASITIDGKTVALTHGRAWRTGTSMGIPEIEIFFAEKDLAGVNWWQAYKYFEDGQRGIALKLHPGSAPGAKRDQEPYHYVFDSSSSVATYAGNCHNWNEAVLDVGSGAKITDISVSKNTVSGKVEWQGKAECIDPAVVTAWSAQFSLPLEEPGEMPAE